LLIRVAKETTIISFGVKLSDYQESSRNATTVLGINRLVDIRDKSRVWHFTFCKQRWYASNLRARARAWEKKREERPAT